MEQVFNVIVALAIGIVPGFLIGYGLALCHHGWKIRGK